MKGCTKRNPAVAAIGAMWFSIAVPARALQYGCAAERDARRGFLYTAAMEWRKAAELFAPGTRAADYFWQKWERAMQLPRRLAGPIGISQTSALLESGSSATQRPAESVMDQISLPTAA